MKPLPKYLKSHKRKPDPNDPETRRKHRALLFRLFGMLMPWRRWIILSNVCIILSSLLNAFSLVLILPILTLIFSPETMKDSSWAEQQQQAEVEKPPASDSGPRSLKHRIKHSLDAKKAAVKNFMKRESHDNPIRVVYVICILFGIATLARVSLDFASDVCIVRVQTEFMRMMTRKLFLHCVNQDLAFFQRYPIGSLMNRIHNDVAKLNQPIMLTYGTKVRQPIMLLCLTVLLFFTHVWMALLVLIAVPILLLPAFGIARAIRKISRGETGVDSSVMELLQERLSGIRLIKSFGAEDHESRQFDAANDAMFERRRRRGMLSAMNAPIMEMMTTLGIIGVILLGVQAVLGMHWISGERYIFFLGVLSRFYRPLKDLSGVHTEIQRPLMSAEAVFDLLDTERRIIDAPDAVPFPTHWRQLQFENLNFSYGHDEKSPRILKNLNLTFAAGESVAIIGPNGSGKSTMAALICRFYDPNDGRIALDGLDYRSIQLQDLRRHIGIVDQKALLFQGSVADNIAYGEESEQIDMERVKLAAERAGAAPFIERLKKGYNTWVGPLGSSKLSGGQQQLIALARIFYRDPPIVIYDEPTSHLDAHAEAGIVEVIQSMMKERTVFLITHDFEHARGADRVIRLDHGTIAEDYKTRSEARIS